MTRARGRRLTPASCANGGIGDPKTNVLLIHGTADLARGHPQTPPPRPPRQRAPASARAAASAALQVVPYGGVPGYVNIPSAADTLADFAHHNGCVPDGPAAGAAVQHAGFRLAAPLRVTRLWDVPVNPWPPIAANNGADYYDVSTTTYLACAQQARRAAGRAASR